jgi:hypothetical protein
MYNFDIRCVVVVYVQVTIHYGHFFYLNDDIYFYTILNSFYIIYNHAVELFRLSFIFLNAGGNINKTHNYNIPIYQINLFSNFSFSIFYTPSTLSIRLIILAPIFQLNHSVFLLFVIQFNPIIHQQF